MKVFTFDTTLRDGTQGEGISLSADDKVAIAQKLDELGIDYIEGGWPGSNPKDEAFFIRARELKLQHARLAAFGSTRLAKNSVQEDRSVRALLRAGVPVITIFGKTWDLHVRDALRITLEENLKLISETVEYLKSFGKEVIFDAEHFFDGYAANPEFAMKTLETAKLAGADALCLCDTNGGTLPPRIGEIVKEVRNRFDGTIGIHTHNDSELAVANALAAVREGADLVQGCLNGYGERCGNANLASIIANLELKMGYTTIGGESVKRLKSVCNFIAEVANVALPNGQPFVGKSAFAHKGGVHVSAVLKDPVTYEHVPPGLVGNSRRVLVSDLAGRSNIEYKLRQYGLSDRFGNEARRNLLELIKQMEHEGYDLESAEGTFELLVRSALDPQKHFFDVERYAVQTGKSGQAQLLTTATVTLRSHDAQESATASGNGPLHALNRCLRTCLRKLYPQIKDVRLIDYKVRLVDSRRGAGSGVRVLIEWADQDRKWTTVGISENLVEASWKALTDAMRLELFRMSQQEHAVEVGTV